MPYVGSRVTVTNAATLIIAGGAADREYGVGRGKLFLKVPVGGQTVYLGDATVTTSTGFALDPGETLDDEFVGQGDVLYGIVASGTQVVQILLGD